MMLKELLKKKLMEGKKADPLKLEAMKNVIKELEDISDEGMASNLKKVTVASDSTEGLKKGLDMAEDKVGEMSDSAFDEAMEEAEGDSSSESEESESLEDMQEGAKLDEREDMANEAYAESDYDSMSPEDLEAEIAKLKSKLRK